MRQQNLNLNKLNFLIADANSHFRTLCQSILRSLGAIKVYEASDAADVERLLAEQRVDFLLCDLLLPPEGGLELARAIRRHADSEYRKIPILILTSDTRVTTVAAARDAGANMVVAKPVSVSSLHSRLTWVTSYPRVFIESPTYSGPDRRFRNEGYPPGRGRRQEDRDPLAARQTLEQDDIDSLLKA